MKHEDAQDELINYMVKMILFISVLILIINGVLIYDTYKIGKIRKAISVISTQIDMSKLSKEEVKIIYSITDDD